MRYYLIAGEASGDLHGANLMKGLKEVDDQAEFRFWGGDKMLDQGGTLVKHYKDHNIMGFWEVLMNLPLIKKNFTESKRDVLDYKPDVLILIDYPGFNLRIARFAKKHGIKVFYYISPKIWAWKESRIKKIKAYVDRMFVIFPFEKDFYKKHHFDVEFNGNPLIDAIDDQIRNSSSFDWFVRENNLADKPIIAILPGSRKQEIDRNLSVMLEVMKDFPDHQFVIAGAPSIEPDYYSNYLIAENLYIVFDKTYELFSHAKAAIITSGTATLEAALFNVPQVVCYKANPVSYRIAKAFVKVKFISLVNLNMNREVVKELIQDDMTKESIQQELRKIVYDKKYRSDMVDKYHTLRTILGDNGASERIAKAMYKKLQK